MSKTDGALKETEQSWMDTAWTGKSWVYVVVGALKQVEQSWMNMVGRAAAPLTLKEQSWPSVGYIEPLLLAGAPPLESMVLSWMNVV